MNFTSWKPLICGVLLAPLITIPITIIYLYIVPHYHGYGFENKLFIALFGLVVVSYPATLLLGLIIYLSFENKQIGLSPWIYVIPAFILTATIGLLYEDGFYGIFLSCAIGCSWAFWFIAIHWPHRANKKINKDT